MQVTFSHSVYAVALQMYDQAMFLREHVLGLALVQLVLALFFLASLVVAMGLFVYWSYCAVQILSGGEEISDRQLKLMRWDLRCREFLVSLTNLYCFNPLS
jgi:hypothetical protein